MNTAYKTLDLNKPADALVYIKGWIEADDAPLIRLEEGTSEDYLRVAMQLFVFYDPREPAGGVLH